MENNEQVHLDESDRKILRILKENAKLNIKEIAAKIGLTNTPVYERIKRMEKQGVIKNYTVTLNHKIMGSNLIVFCNVQLKSHASEYLDEFENKIIKLEQIETCYHIAGHFDYLLKINASDMEEYSVFIKDTLSKIPHIATVQSSFVMRTLKEQ